VLENHRYAASGFWHGATLAVGHIAAVEGVLLAFGHTSPHQVYLRALAMDGVAMGGVLQGAVNRINAAWGLQPIPLRRFTS
jgi:hypothetical protein